MKNVLITGGSGFFGSILEKELANKGFKCVNIDLERDDFKHENLQSVQGDICDKDLLEKIFSQNSFDCVFHFAAILAHAVKDKKFLWNSNVEGTRNVVSNCKKYGVKNLVFTSSNCLWAQNFHRPVLENDLPNPVEIYGKSKLEGEKILQSYSGFVNSVIIRCPTIMDGGRLGLLGILFEFIDEGRKVWTVGGGDNVYQFIYAKDLADACLKAMDYPKTEIFNIGSDNVKSFKEVYDYVIKKSGNTKAKVASLPRNFAIPAMKIAHALKISPLGPYQYKMIAEDFIFDTSKIKEKLNWRPTMSNEDMLLKTYLYYRDNKDDIKNRKNVSAHKQSAKMGIIKLLKWIS
ncbi:MAG: NAD(P)-dependent oxidoreductase [Endomicrobium sp.]|jgi:nucleoside-diphosphate-sugar epimerase|nr:NAD(P)-dependent oxidoreductase [Endomicrobium sp.]